MGEDHAPAIPDRPMHPVLNDTKWAELRRAMLGQGRPAPRWRTRDLNGHLSDWDGEWFHHFAAGGCGTIEWVEIEATTSEQDAAVAAELRAIHLPGERTDHGYRVFGFWDGARPLHYL